MIALHLHYLIYEVTTRTEQQLPFSNFYFSLLFDNLDTYFKLKSSKNDKNWKMFRKNNEYFTSITTWERKLITVCCVYFFTSYLFCLQFSAVQWRVFMKIILFSNLFLINSSNCWENGHSNCFAGAAVVFMYLIVKILTKYKSVYLVTFHYFLRVSRHFTNYKLIPEFWAFGFVIVYIF
jgi:hypothetical protein